MMSDADGTKDVRVEESGDARVEESDDARVERSYRRVGEHDPCGLQDDWTIINYHLPCSPWVRRQFCKHTPDHSDHAFTQWTCSPLRGVLGSVSHDKDEEDSIQCAIELG